MRIFAKTIDRRDRLNAALVVAIFAALSPVTATANDYSATLRQALAGDYQARRNMAFCFRTGDDGFTCRGWPKPQPIEACAWRAVVVFSGDGKVDSLDTTALKIDCGKLNSAEIMAAEAKATRYGSGQQ